MSAELPGVHQGPDAGSGRVLAWVSAGAASAVAASLALKQGPVTLAYADTRSEHSDNARFLDDLEEWYGQPILRLGSEKYHDVWDVWKRRKFIMGHHGAPCTVHLKKEVRFAFQQPDDRHVFGYTIEEKDRVEQLLRSDPGLDVWCPLIDEGLDKQDCFAMIEQAGLRLPAIYDLGYDNANCIGCPKGGMGYWTLGIRKDFPEVYDRMAGLERSLDHSLFDVFLDEMPAEGRGNFKRDQPRNCSILCAISEDNLHASDESGTP